MLTARQRFVEHALQLRGRVVLWGDLDCSDLVARALKAAGGRDFTKTHRAQDFADQTHNLATMKGAVPLPADLAFYGTNWASVIHVAIHLGGGRVLSADGATSRVTELALAQANPNARVREHDKPDFRRDFLGSHRNTFVDDLDGVCL